MALMNRMVPGSIVETSYFLNWYLYTQTEISISVNIYLDRFPRKLTAQCNNAYPQPGVKSIGSTASTEHILARLVLWADSVFYRIYVGDSERGL